MYLLTTVSSHTAHLQWLNTSTHQLTMTQKSNCMLIITQHYYISYSFLLKLIFSLWCLSIHPDFKWCFHCLRIFLNSFTWYGYFLLCPSSTENCDLRICSVYKASKQVNYVSRCNLYDKSFLWSPQVIPKTTKSTKYCRSAYSNSCSFNNFLQMAFILFLILEHTMLHLFQQLDMLELYN